MKKQYVEEYIAERMPVILAGRPRLYQAWLVYKDYPGVKPITLAKLVGAYPTDGSRLLNQLKELSMELRRGPSVFVPTRLEIRKRGEILVWDKLWDLYKRHGFPHKTSLREIAALTDLHRVAVGRFMKALERHGLVEYKTVNSNEFKGVILISIPEHIELSTIMEHEV